MKKLPLLLFSVVLIQTGCVGFYGHRSTYAGRGAEVNGAQVSMSVKPEGTSGGSYALSAMVVGVAMANLDDPFRWRIEAEGKERKVVKFRLDPAEKKQSETIFLPAEIVTSIGKPMSEWEEKGWDRQKIPKSTIKKEVGMTPDRGEVGLGGKRLIRGHSVLLGGKSKKWADEPLASARGFMFWGVVNSQPPWVTTGARKHDLVET